MLIEHRIYVTRTELTKIFVQRYRDVGMPIQQAIFGVPLAFLTTEIGPIEQVILIWRFDDFEDRVRKRSTLEADPAWLAFLKEVAPMVTAHESRLMRPVLPI